MTPRKKMREAGDSDYQGGAVEIAAANGLPSKICGLSARVIKGKLKNTTTLLDHASAQTCVRNRPC
jgi:hypothetical protein